MSTRMAIIVGSCTALLALVGCAPEAPEPATLILENGRVFTVDEDLPEADALAIRGDRIVAVGAIEEIRTYRGPETRTIDLGGRLVIPGFIEGHGHLMGIGNALMNLDLMGTGTWQEVVDRVEEAVQRARPGDWIVGRGWHQSKWDPAPRPMVRGFQTHAALSAVSPDNPVWLTHASGHAGIANARAMELAGVEAGTPSPSGGEIITDQEGEPTGVFVETAQSLIGRARARAREDRTPEERRAEARQALRLAVEEVLSKGVTSFQDAGSGPDTIDLYRAALEEGELPLRLWVMLRTSPEAAPEVLPAQRVIGLGNDHLTVRAIKMGIDGALGSRGAWLLEDYADDPGNAGHNTTPVAAIRRMAELALEHGYQLCVHAIGDRANREVLDVYEAAFAERPEDAEEARFRIEHAQILHPTDVPRFAELGVIASMQGIHATSDGSWTPDRLGPERTRERAYVFRDLWDSGALVTNGTDAPVEDVDPIPAFHGMTVGRMPNDEPFQPQQMLSRQEALRAYTLNAAIAAFEEEIKGSITPGKLADVVVLSRDILQVPDDEILGTEVVYTIVGGEVVHAADGAEGR